MASVGGRHVGAGAEADLFEAAPRRLAQALVAARVGQKRKEWPCMGLHGERHVVEGA